MICIFGNLKTTIENKQMYREKIQKWINNFKYFKRIVRTYAFRKYNIFEVLILWAKRHLNRFQFLVLSGIIVGFLGAAAGIILKASVHYIQVYTVEGLPLKDRIVAFSILPILGIVATTLVARYLYRSKKDIKLSQVLVDIAQNDSNISKQEIHSRVVQSAITVGFGGSAGLETPSAITGAAIGSNFGRRYRLGYKEKTLLLAGGAAAGIASAFNAPVAGVMFSFEVLLTGVVFSDFIPLVISSMCGSLLTQIVLNNDILFSLNTREPYNYANTLYFVILGLIAGFYTRYYNLVSKKVSNLLDKFPYGGLKRAVLGGAILAALCVAFPSLYGEGYGSIKMLSEGEIQNVVYQQIIDFFGQPEWTILIMLALSTLFKPVATSASLNSGGVGGNFAPSLIAGGLMGYTFGYALIMIGFKGVPLINLMLVGMAGVLAGVMYAPLTAIFLIAEASSGYDLFIPLMIVSVTSFLINKYFSPINPDYVTLAEEGKIFTSQNDRNIVNQVKLSDCLDKESISVNNNALLKEVNTYFEDTDKSVIAVVDDEGRFWGMINKEQINKIYAREKDQDSLLASQIAIIPSHIVRPDETVENIVKKFEEADTWYLPIVDENLKYLGIVSRFRFLVKYRQLLKNLS